jgi:hypothetical protein
VKLLHSITGLAGKLECGGECPLSNTKIYPVWITARSGPFRGKNSWIKCVFFYPVRLYYNLVNIIYLNYLITKGYDFDGIFTCLVEQAN